MAHPQTTQPAALPIPVLGLNKRDPLASMDPRYAPWILNYEPEPQFCKVRGGYVIHATVTGEVIKGMINHGDDKLLVYTTESGQDNDIYDITSGTPVSESIVGLSGVEGAIANQFKFANRSAFIASANADTVGQIYDGSSWTAWGFEYPAATAKGGIFGCSYKGRVYFGSGKVIYYSDVDAVTGTCSELDLEYVFDEDANIKWCSSLTSPSRHSEELLFAVGNEEGEILVYGGDNPGENNWGLVGRFKVAKILNSKSVLAYNNDVWLMTATGIVSLRKLFQYGSDNLEMVSVSEKINPYWRRLVEEGGGPASTSAAIAYWPEQNKVYVKLKGYIDDDNSYNGNHSTMLVYNGYTGGWIPQKLSGISTAISGLVSFQDGIYFVASNTQVLKLDPTVFKDEYVSNPGSYFAYDHEIRGAYTNLGSGHKNKRIHGFEPVLNTDFDGSNVTMKAAADMGRELSGAATHALPSGYSVPFYSVGAEGTYLQYRMLGTTDTTATTGLELYSMGMAVK